MPRPHNHDRTYTTPAGCQSQIDTNKGIDADKLPVHGQLGTAAYLDQTWLYGSVAWDANSCAQASQTGAVITVPGAEVGDFAFVSASITLSGLHLFGSVTATNTVTFYVSNLTGAAVDLASATYYVAVLKRVPTR